MKQGHACHALPICAEPAQKKHQQCSCAVPCHDSNRASCCTLTVEHNEDLLPLCVAHFGRLAEQDLVFVADKDAVQDELADGDMSQIPEAAVLTHGGEQTDSLVHH